MIAAPGQVIPNRPEVDEDRAYLDGIEDLADKVIELIYGSDFEISLTEIIDFLENEKGYSPEPVGLAPELEALLR